MQEYKKTDMEATLKSWDTEEFIDIHFYRPMGYRWALFFRKAGISPNSVTRLAIFIGIAAGVCFYFQNLYVNIAGMLLLVWANTYDSADGQLARMTGQMSAVGRMLDGLCGELWFITIYLAICFRLMPEWGFYIWILAAAAGFCHSKQAAMADYYRNLHLHFLKGKAGSELSNSQALRKDYEQLSWRRTFFYTFACHFYMTYTAGQEKQSPRLQQMLAALRTYHKDEAPEWFRTSFRQKSLPLMKYANILSFNTRAIALFISIGINMPWLYFVFELSLLNILLVYMVVTHERFSAEFTQQLKSQPS
ncbi:MAG: CDP-alcohol phosphatidyltransferase family protein [Tannerellaceae bacterium]|jgi:hypothetical protein|nr:CDP-alcohol phosphatidyltransferase family protein [Tannerellaceae bacterium]